MNRKQRRAAARERPAVGTTGGFAPGDKGAPRVAARNEAQFAVALKHHQAGRLSDAETLYRTIIASEPRHFGSLYLLGMIARQRGQSGAAIDLIGRAIAIRPDYAEAHNNIGSAFQDQGNLEQAIFHYRRAISISCGYAQAHNNLGTARKAQGKLPEAVASYRRALTLKPDDAAAHNNLGNALADQGRIEEAVTSYRRALAIEPDYFEAHNNLGTALIELKQVEAAIGHLERAAALKPQTAETHNNLGNALKDRGQLEEAIARYRQALSLKPDYAEAHNNMGAALQRRGRLEEAMGHYQRALALRANLAQSHTNLGTLLLLRNDANGAVAAHQRALALKPNLPEAHNSLGAALAELGKTDEAIACHARALALKPDFAEARLALCMSQLPVLYADETEIEQRRKRYRECLTKLCEDIAADRAPRDLSAAVGSSQPFYLAYQGHNDKDLQALYGSAMCRLLGDRYGKAPLASAARPGERVRVGIVSGFFRNHSNWKIPIKGWLRLDRERFEIFGYHTGLETDDQTSLAASLCDRFVQAPLSIESWRSEIVSDAPHVLIYPEVGMDPLAATLAAQRLAPVQCNAWGHPQTSGFPTLDYYLSSDLMEPADAEDHYTEQLVRLPNLSIFYEAPDFKPAKAKRADLGLRADAVVYWCGQSLFKYLPQYDEIFPRIAQAVGACQFVFVKHQRGPFVDDGFRKRLVKCFAAFGLNADDHCVLLPRLEAEQFIAAIGQCDIVLDSIGWSGCNSTLESLAHNLPIVTMPGKLMRGRHGAAILTMMGVRETVAESVDAYVAKAARLAHDLPWRMQIRGKIADGKHRIYRDRSCIEALQDFLAAMARGRQIGPSGARSIA